MAEVEGSLLDWKLQSMDGLHPKVLFIPSSGAVTLANQLLPLKRVAVVPNGAGGFTAQLAPTESLRPEVWYTVHVEWIRDNGDVVGSSTIPGKLMVPAMGGKIGDLMLTPPWAGLTWVGPTEPPDTAPYLFWLDNSTIPPKIRRWIP